jgi:hypothetical protein
MPAYKRNALQVGRHKFIWLVKPLLMAISFKLKISIEMEVVYSSMLHSTVGQEFFPTIQNVLLSELEIQFGRDPPLQRQQKQVDEKVACLIRSFCKRVLSPVPFWVQSLKLTAHISAPLSLTKGFAGFSCFDSLQEDFDHDLKPEEFKIALIVKFTELPMYFHFICIFRRVY